MKHILVVLSNAVDGEDDQFNDWYDNQHLGDVLQVPGFIAARRFRLSEGQMPGAESPYRYLAIYEVESARAAEAAAALGSGAGNMVIDPALDRGRTVAWFYTPLGDGVSRGS
jgi:hypothetical protein